MDVIKYKLNCKMPIKSFKELKSAIEYRNTEKNIFEYAENYNLKGLGEVVLEIKYVPDTALLIMNINLISEGIAKKKSFVKENQELLMMVYDTFIEVGNKRYEFLINLESQYLNLVRYNREYFLTLSKNLDRLSKEEVTNLLNYLDVNNDKEMIYAGYITSVLLMKGVNFVNIFYNKLLLSGIDMGEVLSSEPDKTRFNGSVQDVLKEELLKVNNLLLVLIGFISLLGATTVSASKREYPNAFKIRKYHLENIIQGGLINGLYK